jgi:hypothetical protein
MRGDDVLQGPGVRERMRDYVQVRKYRSGKGRIEKQNVENLYIHMLYIHRFVEWC